MLPTRFSVGIARALWVSALGICSVACLSQPAPSVDPAQPAQPADSFADDLRVSGFGTVGLVHADAPAGWSFRRDIAQPVLGSGTRADVDSRLGLQLNYAPSARLELVGQVVATRRSHYARDTDNIAWAFAAFRPNPDLTLRLGRIDGEQFLISDYRNVGFAYRFARPPVEFYGTLPASIDGGDVVRVWNLEDSRWRAKAYVGRGNAGDLSVDSSVVGNPAYGLSVSREAGGLLLRAGVTRYRVRNTPAILQPLIEALHEVGALPLGAVATEAKALTAQLETAGAYFTYTSTGISYDRDTWLWTAEIAHVSGPTASALWSGYANVGRRFGPFTLFGGASRLKSDDPPAESPAWAAALAPVLWPEAAQQVQILGTSAAIIANHTRASQRTLSVGLRWDLHPQAALKLQWDRTWIDADGGRLWGNATLDAGRADVTSLLLDFVF